MSIIHVGDIHGVVGDVGWIDQYCLKHGIEHVVQVGDFGILWPGAPCRIHKYFQKRAIKHRDKPFPTWWTCGGNHDNWDKIDKLHLKQQVVNKIELAPGCYLVPRGQVVELSGVSHLFCGGAESTDKHHRVEGKSWWARETPTYQEFCAFALALETQQPQVIVTHDAPLCVPIYREGREENTTPRMLQKALETSTYKPPVWVFGHHHLRRQWKIEDTLFACCGIGTSDWTARIHKPEFWLDSELK